jgi:hypothetical protein
VTNDARLADGWVGFAGYEGRFDLKYAGRFKLAGLRYPFVERNKTWDIVRVDGDPIDDMYGRGRFVVLSRGHDKMEKAHEEAVTYRRHFQRCAGVGICDDIGHPGGAKRSMAHGRSMAQAPAPVLAPAPAQALAPDRGTTATPAVTTAADELAFRTAQWRKILEAGGPDGISPGFLREIRVYGGAQGIWQDNARTFPLSDDRTGATVSVLHTGRHYPDDLSAEAITYHYPSTSRRGRDAAEVAATKHASELDLPVFVITPDPRDQRLRSVRRAFVESWDDDLRAFRLVFEIAADVPLIPQTGAEEPPDPGSPAPKAVGYEGAAYRPADEASVRAPVAPFAVDPNVIDRGTRGHARTQNALAEWAAARGYQPTRPGLGQPDYDVAWLADEVLFVAEVKSLTRVNEVRQLRLGLGQVLHYRHLLATTGRAVRAVLAVEREPSDDAWKELCTSVGVQLVWPSVFTDALSSSNAAATYLEVWDRHVNAADDPSLDGPAAGGPDTGPRKAS